MSMKALTNIYSVQVGWAPVAVAATKTSSAIDFANAIENLIMIIPGLWTDGTSYTYSLTYSGTAGGAGTYTAGVAGTDYVGTLAVVSSTATSTTPQKIAYIGPYQYVKIVATVVGATTGAIAAVIALIRPRKQNAST